MIQPNPDSESLRPYDKFTIPRWQPPVRLLELSGGLEAYELAKERFLLLYAQIETNATNIRAQFPMIESYKKWFSLAYGLQPHVSDYHTMLNPWLTTNPWEIFGSNKTFYHVSSSATLSSLMRGHSIEAPIAHDAKGVITHRGVGLVWMDRLIHGLGFNTADKDFGVWMSEFIDNEQVMIEDGIARTPPYEVTLELIRLFYGSQVNSYSDLLRRERFHEPLHQILMNFSQDGPNLDAEAEEYLSVFMNRFFQLTGTREGWWQMLYELLQGTGQKVSRQERSDPRSLVSFFELSLRWLLEIMKEQQLDSVASQSCVFEIDGNELFKINTQKQQYPLFPGDPISLRDRNFIASAPRIQLPAIKRVWAMEPDELASDARAFIKENGVGVERIVDLPAQVLMDPGTPIRNIDLRHLDPSIALCDRRYARPVRDRILDWRSLIASGLIAPLRHLEMNYTKHKRIFYDTVGLEDYLFDTVDDRLKPIIRGDFEFEMGRYQIPRVY